MKGSFELKEIFNIKPSIIIFKAEIWNWSQIKKLFKVGEHQSLPIMMRILS